MLVNTTEAEQEAISNWFSKVKLAKEVSIYFYNNEKNVQWLVTAFAVAKHRYINIDNTSDESYLLTSHFLSSDNCYYTLTDPNLFEVFRLLNTSKLNSIEEFLERVIPIEHDEASEL